MAEMFAFEADDEEVTIISDDSDMECSVLTQVYSHCHGLPYKEDENSGDYEVIDISDDSCMSSFNPNHQKLTRDDFEFCKVIGLGGYGKVYQARKKTGTDRGTLCAMKVLKKAKIIRSLKETAHTKTERNILQDIKHPFIVELLYAFQTEGRLYLGLEYMCGGELFSYMNKERMLYEDSARFYISEIVLAIEHLHSHGIVYRDLKPENILVGAQGHIKLCDFGLCKEHINGDAMTHTFCGTIDYMAPEILSQTGHERSVDWWSLGVMLYEMLTGYPPFKAENRKEALEKIMKLRLKFESFITNAAKDLIRKLLKLYPKRLGCGPNGAALIKRHQFFRPINWEDVLQQKLEPPFKPKMKDIDDVSNFDRKFTSLEVKESPENFALSESAKQAFKDFSYNAFNDNEVGQRTFESGMFRQQLNDDDIEIIDIS
ncbi:ribosomal protein S6 kinase beta-2-like isoform X2 [Trichogramma pretiosum]|uniref:ribosomal protein S6 kinase beta-2-like isoform X2 n=1 Tax=Trichogramma pretiosum TaxID=7493 RepID=UPI000C71A45D|nr:ribosomal protein S6 kinase beta-2-like isoform X2 [Trichogramma pretiosum]